MQIIATDGSRNEIGLKLPICIHDRATTIATSNITGHHYNITDLRHLLNLVDTDLLASLSGGVDTSPCPLVDKPSYMIIIAHHLECCECIHCYPISWGHIDV